jgi:2-dehydro-3-deoxyphosphogluconate aldolase/(4S)-4-hydroxy-2-oxoglutarate aldolase
MIGTDVATGGAPEASAADPLAVIAAARILPVLVVHDATHAWPLGQALKAGGLPCAEVTFRTESAVETLRTMAEEPEIAVGAGTVLSVAQVEMAVAAGARYIVTPSFNREVVRACQEMGVPVIPGIATPTELQMALDAGIRTVKFFPAEAMGGVKTLAALAAPFSMMRFIPTGGVNETNVADYLAHPAVFAVGGSWMAPPQLVGEGRFEEITRLTRSAVTRTRRINSTP